MRLEHSEDLLNIQGSVGGGLVGDHVEPHGLSEGSALSDGHDISLLHLKGGAQVDVDVFVALLVSSVLGDVVEVIAADDNGVFHLGGEHEALQNSAADAHVSGEGALLVDVVLFGGGGGGLESEADVLCVLFWEGWVDGELVDECW